MKEVSGERGRLSGECCACDERSPRPGKFFWRDNNSSAIATPWPAGGVPVLILPTTEVKLTHAPEALRRNYLLWHP